MERGIDRKKEGENRYSQKVIGRERKTERLTEKLAINKGRKHKVKV